MIKKGSVISTVQYPHEGKQFVVDVILHPKSLTPIFACHEKKSGMHVNLLPCKCFKLTGNYKVDLIQRIKLGSRVALKEYIKVYKAMPPKPAKP